MHENELSILKLYYTGDMTLDQLSAAHECDAGEIIANHEARPADEQQAIMGQVDALRVVDCGLAPPDHPMFTGGVRMFSMRRMKRKSTE